MSRVLQMINQHDVLSVELKRAENGKRADGTKYQTMDIVVLCKYEGDEFKLELTLFSADGIEIEVKQ